MSAKKAKTFSSGSDDDDANENKNNENNKKEESKQESKSEEKKDEEEKKKDDEKKKCSIKSIFLEVPNDGSTKKIQVFDSENKEDETKNVSKILIITNVKGKDIKATITREGKCENEEHTKISIKSGTETTSIGEKEAIKIFYYDEEYIHKNSSGYMGWVQKGVNWVMNSPPVHFVNNVLQKKPSILLNTISPYFKKGIKYFDFFGMPEIESSSPFYKETTITFSDCSGNVKTVTVVSYPDIEFKFDIGINLDKLVKKSDSSSNNKKSDEKSLGNSSISKNQQLALDLKGVVDSFMRNGKNTAPTEDQSAFKIRIDKDGDDSSKGGSSDKGKMAFTANYEKESIEIFDSSKWMDFIGQPFQLMFELLNPLQNANVLEYVIPSLNIKINNSWKYALNKDCSKIGHKLAFDTGLDPLLKLDAKVNLIELALNQVPGLGSMNEIGLLAKTLLKFLGVEDKADLKLDFALKGEVKKNVKYDLPAFPSNENSKEDSDKKTDFKFNESKKVSLSSKSLSKGETFGVVSQSVSTALAPALNAVSPVVSKPSVDVSVSGESSVTVAGVLWPKQEGCASFDGLEVKAKMEISCNLFSLEQSFATGQSSSSQQKKEIELPAFRIPPKCLIKYADHTWNYDTPINPGCPLNKNLKDGKCKCIPGN